MEKIRFVSAKEFFANMDDESRRAKSEWEDRYTGDESPRQKPEARTKRRKATGGDKRKSCDEK